MLDFRSVRYKKKHMFDEEAEYLSEFEMDDQDKAEKQSNKQSSQELSEKFEPSKSYTSDKKCQKIEEK